MYTTFDQTDIIYDRLLANPTGIASKLTGEVWKDARVVAQGKPAATEDLVINALSMGGDQIQLCTANVNIYVPDVKGPGGQWFPNNTRLNELTKIAYPELYEGYGDSWQYNLSSGAGQTVFEETETQSHYVNFRIDFRFYPS